MLSDVTWYMWSILANLLRFYNWSYNFETKILLLMYSSFYWNKNYNRVLK